MYLTYLHQYNEAYYVGLTFLTRAIDRFPGNWDDKNIADENGRVWDAAPLRLRAMACDTRA